MALTEQGTLTSSDHAGAFSLIDALDDDALSLVKVRVCEPEGDV